MTIYRLLPAKSNMLQPACPDCRSKPEVSVVSGLRRKCHSPSVEARVGCR